MEVLVFSVIVCLLDFFILVVNNQNKIDSFKVLDLTYKLIKVYIKIKDVIFRFVKKNI